MKLLAVAPIKLFPTQSEGLHNTMRITTLSSLCHFCSPLAIFISSTSNVYPTSPPAISPGKTWLAAVGGGYYSGCIMENILFFPLYDNWLRPASE